MSLAATPASAFPGPSCPGVCSVMDRFQPVDGHMSVELRCGKRSVTKQFLNAPEIRAPFQQVGRRRMPQPVRAHVQGAGHRRDGVVDHPPDRALVKPFAANTQEKGTF